MRNWINYWYFKIYDIELKKGIIRFLCNFKIGKNYKLYEISWEY